MRDCPWCGSKLFGYERPYDRINRARMEHVACCPWCKWSDSGEQYRELDEDEVHLPY